MKLLYTFFLIFLGLATSLDAQTYHFSTSTGTYTDLVGSTSINNGFTWDDPQYAIPIGFNFDYFGETINEIFIEDFGFGATLATDTSETGTVAFLIPYGADIIDRAYDVVNDIVTAGSSSNISYLLDGNSGSRILKIEWNNVGFYTELADNGVSNDFTNFQLWLFEGSNDIEVHIGPNSITQPGLSFDGLSGSFVALLSAYDIDNDSITGEGIILEGDPTSPTIPTILSSSTPYAFTGPIPEGTIYRFSTTVVGLSELKSQSIDFSISPNPVVNNFRITLNEPITNNAVTTLLNMSGQVVKQITALNETIDVSDLSEGIYFVRISSEFGDMTKKLVKIN